MLRLQKILVICSCILIVAAVVTGSPNQIEPGESVKELIVDLDADSKPEVVVIRRSKPPATFERVEIFQYGEHTKTSFVSEWREVAEPTEIRMSAKGDLSVEQIGRRIFVKYIWREKGEGSGGGHDSEDVTYYGQIEGRFGPALELRVKDSNWSTDKSTSKSLLRERLATISHRDVDGDGEEEVQVTINENEQEITDADKKSSSIQEKKTKCVVTTYKWNRYKGFTLITTK